MSLGNSVQVPTHWPLRSLPGGRGFAPLLLVASLEPVAWEPLAALAEQPRGAQAGTRDLNCFLLEANCPSGPQLVQPRCLDPTWPTLSGRARYRPRSWPAQDQWPLAPRSHPSTQEMQELFSPSSAHPGRDGGGASASGRPRRRAGLGGPTPRLDKRLRLRPARAVKLDWRLTGPQS